MKHKKVISEAVTEGHPDKVCDRIVDSVLDAYLEADILARVGCEALITDNLVVVSGEVITNASINVDRLVRETIKSIGYDNWSKGFDYKTCKVMDLLQIERHLYYDGVYNGANDQGFVYGYAINETDCYMPWSIYLANRTALRLTECRKEGILGYLCPDGKVQICIDYGEEGTRVDSIVVSTQHSDDVDLDSLKEDIRIHVIDEAIPQDMIDDDTVIFINPAGEFVLGGPYGDTGVSGRKLMVDTYGGHSKQGGGALSGKDIRKVDRGAAYMARYLAKNIVASELAKECEICIGYAIGIEEPIVVTVETYGTGKIGDSEIEDIIITNFDLTTNGIYELLALKVHPYSMVSAYGHYGRGDILLPWEQLTSVEIFKPELFE